MIRLIFSLISIPLYIARRIIWKIIWHIVYFFLRRPVILIATLLILSGALGWKIWTYEMPDISNLPELPTTENTNIAKNNRQMTVAEREHKKRNYAISELPKHNYKIENGNSQFAKSLINKMNDEEKIIYSQVFNHVMGNIKAGEEFNWQGNNRLFGQITPQKAFKTKTGIYCRNFTEILAVIPEVQKISGKACQRKSGNGWCKLRNKSAPSCELGYGSGGSTAFGRKMKIFFSNLF